ncbi:hypothetical protein LF1_52620 [Rubripirellula obstinata]|uniref:Uncharacterized protein n=1 Tax=Rubripirellula obstinata TaxID=406547 RepID=A0A5B1CDB9_9BACT|nr:hypothetical protein [Rubripirellula obstinata]KAA1257413.1 hypothetical protein LF1_52620 [Rubripirellula obstinata]
MNTDPYSPSSTTEERAVPVASRNLSEMYSWGATGCLVICALILMFGDIGFDKPGRFGLDFDHAILLIAISLLALLSGLIAVYIARSLLSGLALLASAFLVILGIMAS